MSNKFQELKNLRKSGTNFNENPDGINEADDFQNEEKNQFENFNENENVENLEMGNYNNAYMDENQNNEFANNNEINVNRDEMDYIENTNLNNNDYMQDERINQNNQMGNEENYAINLDDKKVK